MIQKVYCRLNGSAPKDVKVKRYELVPMANTQHYYCWDVCYLESWSGAISDWWVCDDPLTLSPNVLVSDFKAYHWPHGLSGCATYRYVWFEQNNVADSSWVDIQFCTTAVGVEELSDPVLELSIFPNPVANDQAYVLVELSKTANDGSIVLHNSLGERVLSELIPRASTQVELELKGLASGVYFISVQVEGELIRTERLVLN